jgi:hypothetical protein
MCSAPLFNDHVPARILPNYIGFKRGPFAVMVSHQVVFFHLGGLPKLDWASPGKSRRATSSRRLLYRTAAVRFRRKLQVCLWWKPKQTASDLFSENKKKINQKMTKGGKQMRGGNISIRKSGRTRRGWMDDRSRYPTHTNSLYTRTVWSFFFGHMSPICSGVLMAVYHQSMGKEKKKRELFFSFYFPLLHIRQFFLKNTT